MRISDNMRFNIVQAQLSSLSAQQMEAARRSSTGLRVGSPSADPISAAELTRLEGSLRRVQAFQDTVRITRGDAATAENALAAAQSLFVRARELAMQGANETLTGNDRQNLASVVSSLREEFVAIMNTKGSKGYLFGGSQTDSEPFASDGTFSGDDYEHRLEVSPGVVARVNVSGARAFTAAGGTDAMDVLDSLFSALDANDTDLITNTLGQIDAANQQIIDAQADAGLLVNRLDAADITLEQSFITLSTRKGEAGDADPFQSITELSSLSSSIEQAIAVARLTLSQNLTRF